MEPLRVTLKKLPRPLAPTEMMPYQLPSGPGSALTGEPVPVGKVTNGCKIGAASERPPATQRSSSASATAKQPRTRRGTAVFTPRRQMDIPSSERFNGLWIPGCGSSWHFWLFMAMEGLKIEL